MRGAMEHKSDIDPITAQLRSEEARLRRRIGVFTLIPVAVAALLIWFTSSRVLSAQKALAVVNDSLADAREDLIINQANLIRIHAEIDSLEALKQAYFAELEKINRQRAEQTRDQAIDQYQADRNIPRVYLHILNEDQRPRAQRVQEALQKETRLIVPGIEKVAKGPSASELRFFRKEDARWAAQIRKVAARHGLDLKLQDLSARYGTSVKPGTFEIWFGRDFTP